jgi:uncharacterized glyoxalase superfamily protein PhnB
VDDVDAVYARLSERGVGFAHAPRDMPLGLRVAALRDPAGLHGLKEAHAWGRRGHHHPRPR